MLCTFCSSVSVAETLIAQRKMDKAVHITSWGDLRYKVHVNIFSHRITSGHYQHDSNFDISLYGIIIVNSTHKKLMERALYW